MSFRDNIKAKIGDEYYTRIQTEAEKEVALAIQMPLKDKFDEDQYYSPQLLLKEFQADYEHFQKAGLRILPLDLFAVLFRCKLLQAAKSEREFQQRSGQSPFFANRAILPHWTDRVQPNRSVLQGKYCRINWVENQCACAWLG
jgi:hypothetical protein